MAGEVIEPRQIDALYDQIAHQCCSPFTLKSISQSYYDLMHN